MLSGSFLYIPQCIYFYSRCICLHPLVSNFTFHNVSISTLLQSSLRPALPSLHSTMYLFLRGFPDVDIIPNSSLHSTMYLFLPDSVCNGISIRNCLYIPQCIYFYVSGFFIRTSSLLLYIPQCIYFYAIWLLSTSSFRYSFTFHNVSISTWSNIAMTISFSVFTFHNVSISTKTRSKSNLS